VTIAVDVVKTSKVFPIRSATSILPRMTPRGQSLAPEVFHGTAYKRPSAQALRKWRRIVDEWRGSSLRASRRARVSKPPRTGEQAAAT